ncbi:thioredoxin family protein [Hymenobacter crusticola]|uniref:Thioredoxin family protein n=1 Tax=Hymenobacter crusticola TaxID=1770526 RepID=A0A243WJZ8_9BACT|nr:thioredoxin family protein [Hymenobacter crusticola]OUJ76224.1 thioredoxin family protein [Hymenobacter crusticola]
MSESSVTTTPVLTAEQLATGYSYSSYRQLIDAALAQDRTTGPNQSEELTKYTRLNVQRMSRIDKTVQLLPALREALANLQNRYVWLIITEGWCGDAAQIVPVLEAAAQASDGKIETRYLLRDEHPDLMDNYLTNGGRSIPKLVILHADTLVEVINWGPRPAAAQEMFMQLKAQGVSHDDFVTQVHGWYAKDKTQSTQQELLQLVGKLT